MLLLHWIAAHPYECTALVFALLSVLNGALSGPPKTFLGAVLDRVAGLVRSDARGTLSWPIVRRSVFDIVVRAAADATGPTMPLRNVADVPPTNNAGFARLGLLLAVALFVLLPLSLALSGCPRMPAPDGCTPSAQRCHEGVPQVCSPSGRWAPADTRCDNGSVCCRTLSYFVTYPRPIYACVPGDMCVAEPGVPVDGGAR
jgi:hypothetical protein